MIISSSDDYIGDRETKPHPDRPMQRYYFDVISDGDLLEDREGTMVEAGEALMAEAIKRSGHTLEVATRANPPEWWLMEVKNAQRETVGRVSFVVSGFTAHPGNR